MQGHVRLGPIGVLHSRLYCFNFGGHGRVRWKGMSIQGRAFGPDAQPLRVVFISTEVAPWSKVGGLADVLAGLPPALVSRGLKVATIAPRYAPYLDTKSTGIFIPLQLPASCRRGQMLSEDPTSARDIAECSSKNPKHASLAPDNSPDFKSGVLTASGSHADSHLSAELFAVRQAGVERIFVDHPFLRTDDIYGDKGGSLTYVEASQGSETLDIRCSILCQAALAAAALVPTLQEEQGSQDGIVFVANDWPTALQLVRLQYVVRPRSLLSHNYNNHESEPAWLGGTEHTEALRHLQDILARRLRKAATIMCIHNLAYQGVFPVDRFPRLCLPPTALPALSTSFDWRETLRQARELDLLARTLVPKPLSQATGKKMCECPPTSPCTCTDALTSQSLQIEHPMDQPNKGLSGKEEERGGGGGGGGGGVLNFLRAGLLSCDAIVTVSPSYAAEICTPEIGCGLHDILTQRGVTGVMNGIDVHEWNPKKDIWLPPEGRYSIRNFRRGKTFMKETVQRRLGLDVNASASLFVFIGRLTEQKGVDVLLGALPMLMVGPHAPEPGPVQYKTLQNSRTCKGVDTSPRHVQPKLQVAMLGSGEAWMQSALSGLECSFPGQAVGVPMFCEELAHWMLAGADYVLIPSRFEPCGLVALCAARYGAVPIVTSVGGLHDLVTTDVGYALPPLSPADDAAGRAADVRRWAECMKSTASEAGGSRHRKMQRHCMRLDLSWEKSSVTWETLIRGVAQRRLLE